MLKRLIRAVIGQLVFPAIRLSPSESLFCSPDDRRVDAHENGLFESFYKTLGFIAGSKDNAADFPILWGITLGIICDVLEKVDSTATLPLRTWPTFSHWDIRSVVWAMSYKLRAEQSRFDLRAKSKSHENGRSTPETHIVDGPSVFAPSRDDNSENNSDASTVIDDYFGLMRKAIIAALVFRANIAVVVIAFLIMRYPGSVD